MLLKNMMTTVVVKLLGRNLAYSILHNQIFSLWKPSHSFYLMDIENDYFLVKFQSKEDYEMVLTQGLWIVFGQYRTVQPWSQNFNPLQPFPNSIMAWVCLLGLSGVLYKRQIWEEIGSLIGKVAKFDFKMDYGSMRHFA
ncbi:hypothetical protein PVK06_039622 [Gossypium arboreum]|uniref:DUF4283 domain-containing protein n=1 Tax=Gossypium arboreum TaxID=29729 RepID=A0ABR0N3D5_GOSAR|nr:hypothetical protein PVK06_039622 [Gossypium arboreum]